MADNPCQAFTSLRISFLKNPKVYFLLVVRYCHENFILSDLNVLCNCISELFLLSFTIGCLEVVSYYSLTYYIILLS